MMLVTFYLTISFQILNNTKYYLLYWKLLVFPLSEKEYEEIFVIIFRIKYHLQAKT